MAYNENLANRLRDAVGAMPNVAEQNKMGGITFMMNDIVCVRAINDDIMMRCEPAMTEQLLTRKGARRFEMRNKPQMDGWLLISPEGYATKDDFDFWINTALEYNRKATEKPIKKKK